MLRRLALLAAPLAIGALAVPATGLAAPPDRYIVVLKDNVPDPGAVARDHERGRGAAVDNVYRRAIKGYSAAIPAGQVDDVRRDSRVRYVERDGTMTAGAQTLPWGIDRVDADASSARAGDGAGAVSGVTAYVIDSGIDTGHPDLNVRRHVNFAGGSNKDCNGHGTHVAGTVAARDNASDVVGVAPGAPLVGVKVLGCSGSGSTSGVIRGVDWVTADAASRPAVANMSLGGGVSQALDDAVRRSAASGVFYSLAAGNEGVNACTTSPARAGAGVDNGIMTTAATDSAEREAAWSNYGSCVDVWSPGVNILSTRKGGGTTTMSGTSMAAPHTGGGGALLLSQSPGTAPSAVEGALRSSARATGTTSKDGRAISRLFVGGL